MQFPNCFQKHTKETNKNQHQPKKNKREREKTTYKLRRRLAVLFNDQRLPHRTPLVPRHDITRTRVARRDAEVDHTLKPRPPRLRARVVVRIRPRLPPRTRPVNLALKPPPRNTRFLHLHLLLFLARRTTTTATVVVVVPSRLGHDVGWKMHRLRRRRRYLARRSSRRERHRLSLSTPTTPTPTPIPVLLLLCLTPRYIHPIPIRPRARATPPQHDPLRRRVGARVAPQQQRVRLGEQHQRRVDAVPRPVARPSRRELRETPLPVRPGRRSGR